ncbi:MAG: oxidoreductase [Micromonosporaceae bacterium]|nr:oxidoreductase [Micromonosporaceae bacterium]
MSGSVAAVAKPSVVRPSLAVWKFASCDGCQLTLLDCEDELLALAETVHIAYFLEATSTVVDGPYDVSLVEGSITTEEDRERIVRVREQSRILVTVGACATAGGIQALRNLADIEEFRPRAPRIWTEERARNERATREDRASGARGPCERTRAQEFLRVVYARPEYVSALGTSTPISAHVRVDYELRGCPIDRRQLLDLLSALLAGRRPAIPAYSVCEECKLRGTTCVLVARGAPCLGPVTQAGCGAICPVYDRGCFGCFGPMPGANTAALEPVLLARGMTDVDIERVYRTFNAATSTFDTAAGRSHEPPQ